MGRGPEAFVGSGRVGETTEERWKRPEENTGSNTRKLCPPRKAILNSFGPK